MTQIPPPVIWAQRWNKVFITFCVENTKDPKVDIQSDVISFDSVADDKHYKLDIKLFNEIDAEKSIKSVKARNIELVLMKKENDNEFWPQLTKEKQKYHWLKVDFNKWVDEDEEDDDLGDVDMGGMGGGFPGMGGMGGMGDMMSQMNGLNMGGLGDFDGGESPMTDSDDEEDPTKSKTDEAAEPVTKPSE